MKIIKIKSFFKNNKNVEITGNILTLTLSLFAIIANNVENLSTHYQKLIYQKIYISNKIIAQSLKHFTQETLMCFFFLIVAIELKKEFANGIFKERKNILLPLICAASGMIIPIIIFLLFNIHDSSSYKGFGIPCATDIVFAIMIFNLVAKNTFSKTAKIFLLSVSVFDDIGAIILIGLFYSKKINIKFFVLITIGIMAIALCKKYKQNNILSYLTCGIIIWTGLYYSGIHTSISGIIVGFFLPHKISEKTFKFLHPIVNLTILPCFGFTACDIYFDKFNINSLVNPITLGIILGLVIGKQVGILGSAFIITKSKMIQKKINFNEVYISSILAGIGFTMSLFIADIAFVQDVNKNNNAKIGLIIASLLSSILAIFFTKIYEKNYKN